MAQFKITNLSPKKATIAAGDKINLKYNISGDKDTPVKITYSVSSNNNVYLKKGNVESKTHTYDRTLENPPDAIDDQFEVIKKGAKPNASWDEIDIKVTNKNDSNTSTATFTVNFS